MLWTILLFMALNLLENCGLFGLRSAYVLASPGGGEAALALINAVSGVGALVGSALVSLMRPARSRSRVFLWTCLLGCVLNDLPMALGRGVPVWASAALMGSLLMPFLNANLTAGMRARVPVELQGRVFAARDTLQCWTMPVGMFLGGYLADHVFEPFMASASPAAAALARLVGPGPGSGIAVLFLVTAALSIVLASIALCHPVFREMDGDEPAL
jgi:DHA3 family macrolide efflux protein-like MFS transporter